MRARQEIRQALVTPWEEAGSEGQGACTIVSLPACLMLYVTLYGLVGHPFGRKRACVFALEVSVEVALGDSLALASPVE